MADALLRLRESAGWSQSELARQSGVSQSQISRIERGETEDPGHVATARLAAALHVSVGQLLGERDMPQQVRLRRSELAIPHDAPASMVDTFDQRVSELARMVFHLNGSGPMGERGPKNGDGPDGSGDVSQDGYFKIDYETVTIGQDSLWRRPRRGPFNMIPVAG